MLPYPDIDSTAFEIGPLKLRWYGLMYMIGFAIAWVVGRQRAKQQSGPFAAWTVRQVDDLIAYCVLGLVLGARVGYILFYDFAYFMQHPADLLAIWKGGMSFHGGMLGLIVTFWYFSARTGHGILRVADFIAPLACPGLFFGRIGNFINAELWGRPSDLPWAMVFPGRDAGGVPRHPSQLYEAALEGLVLGAVLLWFSSKERPAGSVCGLFLLGYGSFRFLVEFARQPDPQLGFIAFGWLTMGQLLCAPMVLGGAGLVWWSYRRRQ